MRRCTDIHPGRDFEIVTSEISTRHALGTELGDGWLSTAWTLESTYLSAGLRNTFTRKTSRKHVVSPDRRESKGPRSNWKKELRADLQPDSQQISSKLPNTKERLAQSLSTHLDVFKAD